MGKSPCPQHSRALEFLGTLKLAECRRMETDRRKRGRPGSSALRDLCNSGWSVLLDVFSFLSPCFFDSYVLSLVYLWP